MVIEVFYITTRQTPQYHQMSVEDLLFKADSEITKCTYNWSAGTRTVEVSSIPEKYRNPPKIDALIRKLKRFNDGTKDLRDADRTSLYRSFYIPKKTGGLRQIDAPVPELMTALRNLKILLEEDFGAMYHTAAFAYVKRRSTVDAIKRHQANGSRWFAKLDLHDFFGSTTLDFVMDMFSMVYPFCLVVLRENGREELRTALSLAFLNGKLPQGTPISPLITNVMMIPVDFKLSHALKDFERNSFVYTRYADDFTISSKYNFDIHKVENLVVGTLRDFRAPFTLNASKTRYGSSSGSNWNLGIMLNKDNQMTIGYKKKKAFRGMLYNYAMDRKRGVKWPIHDVQTMFGHYSYYKMIEGKPISDLVLAVSEKTSVDIMKAIKEDLAA